MKREMAIHLGILYTNSKKDRTTLCTGLLRLSRLEDGCKRGPEKNLSHPTSQQNLKQDNKTMKATIKQNNKPWEKKRIWNVPSGGFFVKSCGDETVEFTKQQREKGEENWEPLEKEGADLNSNTLR